ncbi:hypothetical protein KA977_03440, partial [Candidatus Dependentiae bacterium]|nr:hypothetical protein [Candidatus Dependentiae bacterium]
MGSIFLFSNNDNEISSIRELLKSEYTVKVFCEEKFLFSNLNSNKIPDIIIIEDSSIDEKIFQYIISKLKTTDKFKNIPIINIFNSDDKDRIKK